MADDDEAAPATFAFGDYDQVDPHIIGDKNCHTGSCGGLVTQYPRPHEGCTGLIHANFGDESYTGDYWFYTKCDVCGESE